jgi:hypothetical protein
MKPLGAHRTGEMNTMSQIEVETIIAAQSTVAVQELLALHAANPEQLEARLAAAIADRLDGLKQETRNDLLKSQQGSDRLQDMAVNDILSDMLDPARQVTAAGLDGTQTAALNDVTKSRAEEQALRDQRTADIIQQGMNEVVGCLGTFVSYQDQRSMREDQLKQLGVDGTVELIRSLTHEGPLDEQLRAMSNDLDARVAAHQINPAAEQAIVAGLNYPDMSSMRDLLDQIAGVGDALAKLKREQEDAFSWDRNGTVMRLELERKELVFDARLAMGLLQREAEAPGGAEIAERTRTRRISPVDDAPLVPGSATFDLAVKEVSDAVKSAVLNLADLRESVEHHAESRLSMVYASLDQIAGLRDANLVTKDEPVMVGGPAIYQLGKGSRAELTEAAHEIPAQIYIGIDEAQFRRLSPDERIHYRLDQRISDDSDLATLARFQAGATNVVPGFVNDVDSLWEAKGLRAALQSGVEELIKQDTADLQALNQAYEIFRAEAAKALDSVRDYYSAQLEGGTRTTRDAARSPSPDEIKIRLDIVEDYQRMLGQLDAERSRDLMHEWIARSERFSKGPEAGSR